MLYQERALVPPTPIGFPGRDNDAGRGRQDFVPQPTGIDPGVGFMPLCAVTHLDDPQHWRDRADEARYMAERVSDPQSRDLVHHR